ncbi:MAG: hypothetical protein AB1813_13565 [Verrucomicrobiota bacterium]
MKFVATEAGFKKGLGGASNSKSAEKYHYVLFGVQKDCQHPENTGIYFEFDDQRNGGINSIKAVVLSNKAVAFKLKGGKSIEIDCNVSAQEWNEFKRGIHAVFPKNTISSKTRSRDSEGN